VHGRKRRVLNNAFSDKALRSAEPFILSNTDRWCELIGQEAGSDGGEWSPPLNMADWVNYLVFDILGDLCFGQSFDMKERDSTMRYVPHLMVEFLELMHPIAYSPFAGFWVWAKPRGLDWLLQFAAPPALKNWEGFVEKCLADRTKVEDAVAATGAEGRKDFFHYLFHAVDPETGKRGFPLEELYGECESLIIAGSDTTAIVMSAMLFYLARNPAVQAKLAAEIVAAFSSSAEIKSGSKLHGCKYLRAFIQEGLRMTPPVSAEPSREVLPGGTEVDGNFFPAGLNVSTGLYCLSYNKDVYPDPTKFRPERWIVAEKAGEAGASEDSVALAELGFCAFSAGSRGCPGKHIAWLEMTIVMAKVVFNFEVKPDPTSNLGGGDTKGKVGRRVVDQYQTYDAFVSMRDGPMVQFKKRPRA
jgi:cytochrome P450